MKSQVLVVFFVTLFAVVACPLTSLSQAMDDFRPPSTNQPGREYPQVNSEGRVRAQILAPDANYVQLDIGGVKYDLAKDENGVWTGESAPQDAGFHYYQLNIDGASVPDPGSMIFFGACRWGSGGGYYPDDLIDHHNLKLVFLSCGSKERPDGVRNSVADLKEAGFNAVSYISNGTAHEFHTWRRSLHQMAQLLFK